MFKAINESYNEFDAINEMVEEIKEKYGFDIKDEYIEEFAPKYELDPEFAKDIIYSDLDEYGFMTEGSELDKSMNALDEIDKLAGNDEYLAEIGRRLGLKEFEKFLKDNPGVKKSVSEELLEDEELELDIEEPEEEEEEELELNDEDVIDVPIEEVGEITPDAIIAIEPSDVSEETTEGDTENTEVDKTEPDAKAIIEDMINFLISDEKEAISGYTSRLGTLVNVVDSETYAKIQDVINGIIKEEQHHIDELLDLYEEFGQCDCCK